MNYGFIGLGNMASAILRGMRASGKYENDVLSGFNRSEGKILALRDSCGLRPASSAAEAAAEADVLVLAVKPQVLPEVLPLIASKLSADQLVISIAAGKKLSYYEEALPAGVPVVRAMPNINAAIGASVTAICGGSAARPEHMDLAEAMLSTIGAVFRIEERLMGAFSALGGCSPAFTYIYIDTLAQAGVRAGLPKALAIKIAAAAVGGSAKAVQESGSHPRELADRVCSPGGTTIEGVRALQGLGFENAVQGAVEAVLEKDARLGS